MYPRHCAASELTLLWTALRLLPLYGGARPLREECTPLYIKVMNKMHLYIILIDIDLHPTEPASLFGRSHTVEGVVAGVDLQEHHPNHHR